MPRPRAPRISPMDRLLVTGGAGFIGSNFVHHLVEHTDARVTVLDKLTYAASPRVARRPARRTGSSWSSATSPTPTSVEPLVAAHDTVVHFAAESHNDNSLDDPEPVRPDQPRRHLHAARGGPQGTAPGSTTSPPTRSTATSSSTTRSGSPRTRRTTRAAPTPPPRPAPTTWSGPGCAASACGRRSPTAPTTTGRGSTSRSSSPARSPNVHRRRPAQASTATGSNVRDWIHADDHSSARADDPRAGPDRRDLPDRRRRRAEQPRRRPA